MVTSLKPVHWLWLAGTFLMTASFLGCLSGPLLEKPKVSLENIRVERSDSNFAKLIFQVKVENPNKVALEVTRVRYESVINDEPLAKGDLQETFRVEGKETRTLDVPIQVKYADLLKSAFSLLTQKQSLLRIQGEAVFRGFNIPFDHKTELKLTQLFEPK